MGLFHSVPMKICLINTNEAWGGGEKWYASAAKELSDRGHCVSVILYPGSPLSKRIPREIDCFEFAIGNLSFLNPFKQNEINELFRSKDFDAVILNLPRDVKFFSKPAKKAGIKKVIYRRGMNHPIKGSTVNRYYYTKFIDGIIANSEEVKRSVSKHIKVLEKKTTVIYNGIDTSLISDPREADKSRIRLGNLGRLVPQKGQEDLIRLAQGLRDDKVDFQLHIGGTGPLENDLKAQIETFKLDDKVILHGEVDPKAFFQEIDFFIFTSRFEGLSNAVLESLQHRVPVICYDIPSNREIIDHGVNGCLVPFGDVGRLKKEIIDLHGDPGKYRSMQVSGKDKLLKKFNYQTQTDKLIDVLMNRI